MSDVVVCPPPSVRVRRTGPWSTWPSTSPSVWSGCRGAPTRAPPCRRCTRWPSPGSTFPGRPAFRWTPSMASPRTTPRLVSATAVWVHRGRSALGVGDVLYIHKTFIAQCMAMIQSSNYFYLLTLKHKVRNYYYYEVFFRIPWRNFFPSQKLVYLGVDCAYYAVAEYYAVADAICVCRSWTYLQKWLSKISTTLCSLFNVPCWKRTISCPETVHLRWQEIYYSVFKSWFRVLNVKIVLCFSFFLCICLSKIIVILVKRKPVVWSRYVQLDLLNNYRLLNFSAP